MPRDEYLVFMLLGYCVTIAIEAPVLVALLSRRHSLRARLFAGVWLTACTYPVVWLVLPPLFDMETQRGLYLLVAETFAPAAECALFWYAFIRPIPPPAPPVEDDEAFLPPEAVPPSRRGETPRDFAVITLANLCSFGIGEVLIALGLFN